VRVGGTGAGCGGLQILAKAYEQRHPGHQVQVLPSIGSTGGIRAVIDGKLDVGCTSRPLKPEERIPGVSEVPWATTAFVFAVPAASPAETLTLSGIEDIYAGRRIAWKDGRPIRLILRPTSDTAHLYLAGLTPGMRAALDRAHTVPGVCIGITDSEAATQLERTPGSFGTTVLGLIVSENRRLRALSVDGVPPSSPSSPSYPFFLTLSLVYRPGRGSAATEPFIEFAQSKEGRRILAQAGYDPLPRGRSPGGR